MCITLSFPDIEQTIFDFLFLPFSQVSERLWALWWKLFGRVVKTAFAVSMGSYWKGIFEKKSNNFYHSRTLRKCFSAFSRRFSSRVDRKKLSKFLIISGHWVKNFRPFVKKIEAGLPELLSTCLQEHFERYFFVKIVLKLFFFFSDTERKFFGFLSFFSNGVDNSVFYVSIGKLRWKIFSKKDFIFSFLLRTLTGETSLIRQAFFSRFEETLFYVSIDLFWGEFFEKKISLSFLDNEHNFFCCKNCILRVPRNILTKVFFEENVYIFYQFLFLSKLFQRFVRILRTKLWKLKSTCRQETFEEN